MTRYQVILAYDGTGFRGFQRQAKRAGRTVQETCEQALRQLGWQGETLLAAGRTDSGVHASGQVIAFDLDWQHGTEALQAALNSRLPADVAARSVRVAGENFHPRYAATGRCYRYQIYCQPVRDPLLDRYAWQVWPAVDIEPMRLAAQMLCGTHDFAAFGTPPRSKGSTVRSISMAAWQAPDPESEGLLAFVVKGNAFLYRMVRRLVSSQVVVGQGRLSLEAFQACLEQRQESMVQGLAPAHGLCLVAVEYPLEI